jgi:hypothetical protein
LSDKKEFAGYSRASLMRLADHLRDAPGIDMLVNLPEDEKILDLRVAEMIPRIAGDVRGNAERGVLCTTNHRLLFFRRIPETVGDRELTTATGYLVECLLRNQPLDRERASRFFPKKESAILSLRERMAAMYFADLLPVISLPLAGLAAFMPIYDPSCQACLDLEIDLRSEGGILTKLVQINPQLRLILGPRYEDIPFPEPQPSLPLVSALTVRELVACVDAIRNAQAEVDFENLPAQLFHAPWAISLMFSSPRAKTNLIQKGEQVSGKLFIKGGHLVLGRKITKTPLFNVGLLHDLAWEENTGRLMLKGPGFHYNIEGEPRSAQFAWIRTYLTELLEVRRTIWEDPLAQVDLEPDAKPDPIGELLLYHFEPCNDPAVVLKARLDIEQVDGFMDGFGQMLPPEETPQGMVMLARADQLQEGLLFTDRALYVRKRGQAGNRIGYPKVASAAQSKKGFLSTSLSIGPLTFKLDSIGKQTIEALKTVLKDVTKHSI